MSNPTTWAVYDAAHGSAHVVGASAIGTASEAQCGRTPPAPWCSPTAPPRRRCGTCLRSAGAAAPPAPTPTP